MHYQDLTAAERSDWTDGYEEGPAGAGWLEGHREARRLACAAADRADAEIDAALATPAPRVRLADYYAPAEPDGGGPGCWPPMHLLFPQGGRA